MKYLIEEFWSDDEGYIAVVPDLPGCSAFGTTPEAAVHETGDAIEAWIAACRQRRPGPPSPRRRPAARTEPRVPSTLGSLHVDCLARFCPCARRSPGAFWSQGHWQLT